MDDRKTGDSPALAIAMIEGLAEILTFGDDDADDRWEDHLSYLHGKYPRAAQYAFAHEILKDDDPYDGKRMHRLATIVTEAIRLEAAGLPNGVDIEMRYRELDHLYWSMIFARKEKA